MSDMEKKYTQEDVDNIVSKAKENMKKKMVDTETYEKLLNEYQTLKNNVRSKEIKEVYLNQGGRQEYFDDFMNLNKSLFEVEDVQVAMKEKTLKHSWAFAEAITTSKETKKEEDDIEDIYNVNKKWG